MCTNQPEVQRGAMSETQLQAVHAALVGMLKEQRAVIDRIFTCTRVLKCPRRKPSAGMLHEALVYYGANASTPFIGDQADDLKAAFHAGCRRILVRSGLGAEALAEGIPDWVRPYAVFDDLAAAARSVLQASA